MRRHRPVDPPYGVITAAYVVHSERPFTFSASNLSRRTIRAALSSCSACHRAALFSRIARRLFSLFTQHLSSFKTLDPLLEVADLAASVRVVEDRLRSAKLDRLVAKVQQIHKLGAGRTRRCLEPDHRISEDLALGAVVLL
jgi:hypothetical protein